MYKLISWLAWPIMVRLLVDTFYIVIDTFWLGLLGAASLAAPRVVFPLIQLYNAFYVGLGAAVTALVGQRVGAKRIDEACDYAGRLLGLFIFSALVSTITGVIILPWFLWLVRAPSDVYPLAYSYGMVLLLGEVFIAVDKAFAAILKAFGDTRTPLKVGAACTIANIVLDPILIFPPVGLGVTGAALATVASLAGETGYAFWLFFTGRHEARIPPRSLLRLFTLVRPSTSIGGPIAGQHAAAAAGFTVMTWIVDGLGTFVVAAYSIGVMLMSVCQLFGRAFCEASSIVAAQNLGAGMRERAWNGVWTGGFLVTASILALEAPLLAFPKEFISIFAHDPLTLQAATSMILLFGPSLVFFNLYMLGLFAASAGGKTLVPSVLGVIRLWGLRIPLSYLLAYTLGLGYNGLWLGMALSNYVIGLAVVVWLSRGSWLQRLV